ncbi:aminotransferase class III-fold pyridoxal phosphate-dependent enzyme [Paracoccus marcusii]|uniref:aminotransferase class III-fold pyridoxal phosphate-dependent enzyme n=1 Tax=Paracoccus marcusii TaxID=59779 RepID=UPI002ED55241|nr:aminotransferase class III-fold pyridoxal phosphate-dependent enzyme [Paracoccus marcusii]
MFVTTGAEACENAVKIARAATKRDAVIAFTGAFHGRTFMGMTLTGKVVPYKKGFGGMMPDVFHAPFPARCMGSPPKTALPQSTSCSRPTWTPPASPPSCSSRCRARGFYPAPTDFVVAIRALCDRHGIVMIADEVQTGFARTGRLFAMEHHGVAADLVTMAKGLGGGLPIAAVTGRAEIMDAAEPGPGRHLWRQPLGIAAGLAVLDVIEEEGLCARADRLGAALKARLEAIRPRMPELADIRGRASWLRPSSSGRTGRTPP